jgi:hypothetical protein
LFEGVDTGYEKSHLKVSIKWVQGIVLDERYVQILFGFCAEKTLDYRFLCSFLLANVSPIVRAVTQIIVPADVNGTVFTGRA